MRTLHVLTCSIVFGAAIAQSAPVETVATESPSAQARDVTSGDVLRIPHRTNDPAVNEGLSTERVGAQARYMFDQLDGTRTRSLAPDDIPHDMSLSERFDEFDIDGNRRIGIAEFQAWFAAEHYERRGDLWFPRIGSPTRDGEQLGAMEHEDDERN
jgi:hypothetical protein